MSLKRSALPRVRANTARLAEWTSSGQISTYGAAPESPECASGGMRVSRPPAGAPTASQAPSCSA